MTLILRPLYLRGLKLVAIYSMMTHSAWYSSNCPLV